MESDLNKLTNEEFWKTITYFKPKEFSHPDKVSRQLIKNLDEYRKLVGKPIIIHSDYRPGDTGQHGKGLAIDFHVKGMNLMDQFLFAERTNLFTGIGVYPDWNNQGLHCDIRTEAKSRWGCWKVNGKQEYFALDYEFFKKYYQKYGK